MAILRTPDGKYVLTGSRPFVVTPGAAPTTTLTLSIVEYPVGNVLAEPVFQRKSGTENDANGGNADVQVLFSHTGAAPADAQARIVSADSGAEIKGWTSLIGVTTDGTNGIGVLPNVPIGCEYLTQIRANGQSGYTLKNGTRRWGVGICGVLAGQSNMIGQLYSSDYNVKVPGSTKGENDYWLDPEFSGTYWGTDGPVTTGGLPGSSGSTSVGAPNFNTASGYALAFMRIIGAALKAKYGRKIPICISVWAYNGTNLADMTPPNGALAQVYRNSGTSAGTIGWKSPKGYTPGDFEFVALDQGEAESGMPGQSRVDRTASLATYYAAMLDLVDPARKASANLAFLPAVLGSYTSTDVPNVERIRGAVYDLEVYAQAHGWPRVHAGWNLIDVDAGDQGGQGLHFIDVPGGNPYKKWAARRLTQAVLKELGCATFGGMGPKVSGVTLAGNVATVTVTHEGGTALVARNSGAPLSGWYGHTKVDFDDTLGAPITVTAAISGAGTVAVTFPPGTVFPAYLKYMGGKVGTMQSQHPDLTNPIYDNAQYPTGAVSADGFTGLPLQPTPDSWRVI